MLSCVAIGLTMILAVPAPKDANVLEPAWGTSLKGLRLGLYSTNADGKPRLMASIANEGKHDLVLNLGLMLANGKKQLPTAVRLTFTNDKGKKRILQRMVGPVAGRVDPFVVPLIAGGRYTIACNLDDYIDVDVAGMDLPMAPGKYRVSAEFVGKAVERNGVNGDSTGFALMKYWTGTVKSDDILWTMPGK